MERTELIEKAAKAMYSPTLWPVTNEETKSRYRAQAEIALDVFEESQKPTEDERGALSNFLFTIYEHGDAPNALQEADAILSFLAGFRRPASPEPTEVEYRVFDSEGELWASTNSLEEARHYLAQDASGYARIERAVWGPAEPFSSPHENGRQVQYDDGEWSRTMEPVEPQAEPKVRHTFGSDDCVTNECDCAQAEPTDAQVKEVKRHMWHEPTKRCGCGARIETLDDQVRHTLRAAFKVGGEGR